MPQTKQAKRRGAIERFLRAINSWEHAIATYPVKPAHERAVAFKALAEGKIKRLRQHVSCTEKAGA